MDEATTRAVRAGLDAWKHGPGWNKPSLREAVERAILAAIDEYRKLTGTREDGLREAVEDVATLAANADSDREREWLRVAERRIRSRIGQPSAATTEQEVMPIAENVSAATIAPVAQDNAAGAEPACVYATVVRVAKEQSNG